MRIQLPIEWSYGRGEEWKVVEADIVDIAPQFSNVATFAVHRNAEPWRSKWIVTNVETGCGLLGGKTRQEAMDRSRDKLAAYTPKQLVDRMEMCRRLTTPRRKTGKRHPSTTAK